jgi:hypothetical protein
MEKTRLRLREIYGQAQVFVNQAVTVVNESKLANPESIEKWQDPIFAVKVEIAIVSYENR